MAALGLLALGMAFALYRYPPPSIGLVLAGGLAVVGVLALTIARYDAAVALGFVIFGVVRVEPAPPDLILISVIAVAFVTGRFNIDRIPLAAIAGVGAFISLNLLSTLEAIKPGTAALFLSITLYLAVFSLWLADYVNSTRRAHLIVSAYLVAAVVSALLGTTALIVPFPGHETFIYAGDRAQALFKDPNVFGPFLVPILLILLEETLKPRLLKLSHLYKYLLILILALGVLFSFSRAAWLNLAIGIVVMLAVLMLKRGGSKPAARLIAVLLVGGMVTAVVLSATGSIHFLDQRASLQEYDTQRFGAQQVGIQYAESHPFGAGPGQFDVLFPIAAHSTYVRVLTEQGILGLVSLLAIVASTLVFAGRNAVLGRSTYGIGSAALLGAWCGVLANSFFVDTLHWRHLWLVAALIWAGAMRRTPEDPPETAFNPALSPKSLPRSEVGVARQSPAGG